MEIATKTETGKRKAKHGPNVKIARICKNMTQDSLAFKMEMSQNKISVLELQDEIDDEALNKLAAALEVPVYSLRDFVPERRL
ncbi:helix-turn-helix transcriptional regulator [Dysgonomonas sp. GY75]|uniref:helix-turn-helix domain-containing protein n=1 Tax=Dysgonomonas sp. GY75 TaxID=2780419 RepID=UPI00188313C9|nr:helix-turn-helix transcriptional regulator [Dysgonomonas sp. GY75]MBF0651531.1 helix-turn-helix transcriptional regulator [Dysgonomonas sp. GY75]